MAPSWLDVTAFGAKGDGSHDDTDAIQAALNASSTGCTVYFPGHGAVYRITSPLTIPTDGIRLRGESTINCDGSTILADFRPVPQGDRATLAFATKNPGAGDDALLVTITGLRDLARVAPGDTISVWGGAHETNNTTSTVVAVDAPRGSLVYYGFANIVHVTGTSPLPVPRDNDGRISWKITKPMIRCYAADVIFENLSLRGGGTVGAVVDATSRGTGGVVARACTNIQFHGCHLDGGVYGVKIGDFSGYMAGAKSIRYPYNCELFVFRGTGITHCSDSAIYVPNDTGQSKFHQFDRCNFQYGYCGIKMRSGSFSMTGGNFTVNTGADIACGAAVDTITVIGTTSELSARFLVLGQAGALGSFGGPYPVLLQGIRADTDASHIAPDGVYIESSEAGGLSIRNSTFSAFADLPKWTIAVAQLGAHENARLCGLEIVGSTFPSATPATIVTAPSGHNCWYWSLGNTVTQGAKSHPMTCPNGLIAAAGNVVATNPTLTVPLLVTPPRAQSWPAGGAVDNLANPYASSVVVTGPTRPVSLSGIVAGEAGQRLELILAYDQGTTVRHDSAASAPGNRIFCPRAADLDIAAPGTAPAYAVLTLLYDRGLAGGAGGWRVVHAA